jgi:two-component system, OmpR family, phosphate regulon response regulator OmpR
VRLSSVIPPPLTEKLIQPHILVVDDDRRIRELLGRYLTQNGFLVTEADQAATARALIDVMVFDVIVLDIMMPGENGLSLTKFWKHNGMETPVLLLTALGEADSRIEGFEAGADDYLPKPFEPRELVLRLQSILKRSAIMPSKQEKTVTICGWSYDAARSMLVKETETQLLTKAEATLLNIFLQTPGQVFSRQDLAAMTGLEGQERTIDVQVTRLRRKVESDPKKPRYLQTIRGEGYVLHVD